MCNGGGFYKIAAGTSSQRGHTMPAESAASLMTPARRLNPVQLCVCTVCLKRCVHQHTVNSDGDGELRGLQSAA